MLRRRENCPLIGVTSPRYLAVPILWVLEIRRRRAWKEDRQAHLQSKRYLCPNDCGVVEG
jgi:hypothetical protein